MKRTNEAIERDLAALIKHGNDLRRDSAELNRTAKELLRKTARLKGVLAKSAWMGRIKQSHESEVRDDRRILYTPNRAPAPQRQPGHGTSREDAAAHVRRRGRLGSV